MALAHDHARVLAPIGGLEDEDVRRRLLADLLEDALAPLGSAIVATGIHSGRHRGSLRLTTTDGASDQVGWWRGVQLLDLPPGLVATAGSPRSAWPRRSHHLAVEVAGGLAAAGRHPEIPSAARSPERRRDLLDAWQRLWVGPDDHLGAAAEARSCRPPGPHRACPHPARAGDRPLVEAGTTSAGTPSPSGCASGLARPVSGYPEPEPGPCWRTVRRSAASVAVASPPCRALCVAPAGVLRSIVGHHVEIVQAPAAGVVQAVMPTAIVLRTDGIGYAGTLMTGDPTTGRLMIGVARPDDELPVGAIDVNGAGTIVVAGARIDVEALTRARPRASAATSSSAWSARPAFVRSVRRVSERPSTRALRSPCSCSTASENGPSRPVSGRRSSSRARRRHRSRSGDHPARCRRRSPRPRPIACARPAADGRPHRRFEVVGRRRQPAGVMAWSGGWRSRPGAAGSRGRLVALADLERLGP
jgi:hypothetical protein